MRSPKYGCVPLCNQKMNVEIFLAKQISVATLAQALQSARLFGYHISILVLDDGWKYTGSS